MFIFLEFLPFNHKLLIKIILTTHHNDSLLYCGTIYRIMRHAVCCHLQESYFLYLLYRYSHQRKEDRYLLLGRSLLQNSYLPPFWVHSPPLFFIIYTASILMTPTFLVLPPRVPVALPRPSNPAPPSLVFPPQDPTPAPPVSPVGALPALNW